MLEVDWVEALNFMNESISSVESMSERNADNFKVRNDV